MNKSHFLFPVDDGLSPAQVAARLRKVFPLVHVNDNLGRYRIGQRIRKLREAGAPQVLLEYEERWQQEALALSVFDGEPLVRVLDLTVQRGRVRAYHAAGAEDIVRRAAAALGYNAEEDENTGDDARESRDERRYWARVRKTRETLAALRGEFEGAEALFIEGRQVSRVRVYGLKMSEPHFLADVQLLPTPGFWNELRMRGILWRWDEFDCGPEFWARGPMIVETFRFGEDIAAAVRYCESLADPEYTPQRRHEIGRAMGKHRQETLTPYLKENLELFWNSTRIGSVSEHCLDDFPRLSGSVEVGDLDRELREALAWRARQEEKSVDDEDEAEQPFPDEFLQGWWLRTPDGTRLEMSWMPVLNFQDRTLKWWYSRRTRGRT